MNKKQREAVNKAWSIIDRAVDAALNSTARSLWSELNKLTLEHERGHRSMGRRFTDGRAGYKESVPLTAKFFAVRAVLRPHTMRGLTAFLTLGEATIPQSTADAIWRAIMLDLAGVRDDVLKGALLRASLEQESDDKNKMVKAHLEDVSALSDIIEEIDYSKDIAVAA